MDYTLAELPEEEQAKLTEELTAVLDKYDAEIGVRSMITIQKRVPAPVESPIQRDDLEDGDETKAN